MAVSGTVEVQSSHTVRESTWAWACLTGRVMSWGVLGCGFVVSEYTSITHGIGVGLTNIAAIAVLSKV